MLSRRRFLAQTSLLTGSAAVAEALFARVAMGTEVGPAPDPKLLDRASSLLAQAPLGTAARPAPDSKLPDRARSLLEQAPLIDTHNDLTRMLLTTRSGDLSKLDMGKVQPTLCADIPRLREGRVGAQYWSIAADDS